jgi:hypothetical protein
MRNALLVIIGCTVLSAATAFIMVSALHDPAASAIAPGVALPGPGAATDNELDSLRARIDELSMEVAALRQQGVLARREAATLTEDKDGFAAAGQAQGSAAASIPGGKDAFKAQVTAVVTQIEEEKEAEEWQEELAGRREEEVKANEEYDGVDAKLDTIVADLEQKLFLGAGRLGGMRDLIVLQNERNREMTRLWAAGETSEEELGLLFAEHRAAHRAEISALLGPEQLGTYRAQLRKNGLGGRFSFFVGPWDDWSREEEEQGK